MGPRANVIFVVRIRSGFLAASTHTMDQSQRGSGGMLFSICCPENLDLPSSTQRGKSQPPRWVSRWGPVGLETAAWEKESASNHTVTAVPKGRVLRHGAKHLAHTMSHQILTQMTLRAQLRSIPFELSNQSLREVRWPGQGHTACAR